MKTQRNFARIITFLSGCLALSACASAQSVYGMTVNVLGADEYAGTTSASHTVILTLKFTGGMANVYTGDQYNGHSETYQWQFFSSDGGSTAVHYGSSATTLPSNGGTVANNDTKGYSYPYTTTLSTPFKGLLTGRCIVRNWYTDIYGTHTTVSTGYQELTYDAYRLRQFTIDGTAIDSRKTYAPPNKDGAYPAADANADPRSVAFAGWSYHGGFFVGNANGVNGDQSGIARVQLQAVNSGAPTSVFTLSLLHIGTPAFFKAASNQWDGAMTLQALVAGSGSNATVPVSSLTWTNALDPATCTGSSGGASLSLASVGANEILNFKLSGSFPDRILVKSSDETISRWRYFGGPAYSPPSPVYPYSECKPHLWGADIPSVSALTSTGTGYINISLWSGVPEGGAGGGTTPPGGGTTPPGGGTTPTDPTPVDPGTPHEKIAGKSAKKVTAKSPAKKPAAHKPLTKKSAVKKGKSGGGR